MTPLEQLDRAARRALVELVRRHPDRTLAEMLSLDGVGERIGALTVGELVEDTEQAASPRPSKPTTRPKPYKVIKTNSAQGQREHDERVLETIHDLGGHATVREIRAALEFGSQYQLTSALRRLTRKRALTTLHTGRSVRYVAPTRPVAPGDGDGDGDDLQRGQGTTNTPAIEESPAERKRLDRNVLQAMRAAGGRASMRDLRTSVDNTTDDQIVASLRRLRRGGRVAIDRSSKILLIYVLREQTDTGHIGIDE